MESFRLMCNDAIRLGLTNEAWSLRRLSALTYSELKGYDVPSCYKLCSISKAAGMLAARRKSIKRGFATKRPCLSKPVLVSCYRFRIEDGLLIIPVGERAFEKIQLSPHILAVLSQPSVKVRSFSLSENSLALCIAKEVDGVQARGMIGVDRNLRNVTAGNANRITYYDLSKTVEIAENTRSIIRSFKRNDVRIRRKLAAKYGRRQRDRTRQILHQVSKNIVSEAKRREHAIALEDISRITRLYRRGNGQGRVFRGRMNSWAFSELKRQVEYKAAWEGVYVLTLSKGETRGTSTDCPRCGERLQAAVWDDREHHRKLWCRNCRRWEDRDLVAAMNISHRGWVRFAQSKGETVEAVKRNPRNERSSREPVILRVDVSKGCLRGQSPEDTPEPQ